MEITIYDEKEQSTEKISFSKNKVIELLQELGINPETVLVIREGEVITEEETLNNNDKIELLSVISGG